MKSANSKLYKHTFVMILFVLAYMLIICAPFDLYLTNAEEFWFDVLDLISVTFPCFFIIMLLVFCGGWFVSIIAVERLDYIVCMFLTVLSAVLWAMYIQGNFVPRNYGVLNGSPIDFSQFKGYGIASLIIWPTVLGVLVCIFELIVKNKKKTGLYCRILMSVAGSIAVMLTVGVISLFPSAKKLVNDEEVIVTSNGEFDVTTDRNVIVLVLDTFDGNYFRELLDEDKNKYAVLLEDFSFYENALGGYNATKYSVPLMLTGKWFEYQQDWDSFIEESYADSELFNCLEDNKYSVGIYLDMPQVMSKNVSLYDNCYLGKYTIAYRKDFIRLLYRLVLFEYMPQQLKGRFIVSTDFFEQLKKFEVDDANSFYDTDDVFYRGLSEHGLSVKGGGKTFKYIHLKGMHLGHMLDENLIEDGKEHTRQEAEHGCMKEIELLLKELKKSGVYNNSAIVIMSDHGGYEENASYLASCPLLLIKGVDEHHNFMVRKEAVSWEQICPTLVSLVTGEDNSLCVWNDYFANDSRRFIHFPLLVNDPQFEEYEVSGNVADGTATYKKTGRVFGITE